MPDFGDLISETAARLAVTAIAGLLGSLLRHPRVVAFIVVGLLVDPVGTGWVMGEERLDLLAELGIALCRRSEGEFAPHRKPWAGGAPIRLGPG